MARGQRARIVFLYATAVWGVGTQPGINADAGFLLSASVLTYLNMANWSYIAGCDTESSVGLAHRSTESVTYFLMVPN